MENEGADAQNLGELPGEQLSVEERDREWNRFMRSSLESLHKYISKRINEMTRVRKRLYGHLPYGKSAIPEAGCVFLMPAVQYPLDNEQMPVIDIQTSFCGSSLFSGQKQLLEEFGDIACVKYHWNLEGLDPNDERYHDNACSDLTDAQVLAKIVQELKNKAITDLAAELTSQGLESKDATKQACKEYEQHQNAADCAGNCTCCNNAVGNLAWPQGIPFTYVPRARSSDKKKLIEHYKLKFKTRWSELKSFGDGAEPLQEAVVAATDLRVFEERISNEFAQNHLRMILSQTERDVASLTGQVTANGSQQPRVECVLEPSGDANAVQPSQDQEQDIIIEPTDVADVRRVTSRVGEEGPSGSANDQVLPSQRGQRGRPRKRKRGRPAKDKD